MTELWTNLIKDVGYDLSKHKPTALHQIFNQSFGRRRAVFELCFDFVQGDFECIAQVRFMNEKLSLGSALGQNKKQAKINALEAIYFDLIKYQTIQVVKDKDGNLLLETESSNHTITSISKVEKPQLSDVESKDSIKEAMSKTGLINSMIAKSEDQDVTKTTLSSAMQNDIAASSADNPPASKFLILDSRVATPSIEARGISLNEMNAVRPVAVVLANSHEVVTTTATQVSEQKRTNSPMETADRDGLILVTAPHISRQPVYHVSTHQPNQQGQRFQKPQPPKSLITGYGTPIVPATAVHSAEPPACTYQQSAVNYALPYQQAFVYPAMSAPFPTVQHPVQPAAPPTQTNTVSIGPELPPGHENLFIRSIAVQSKRESRFDQPPSLSQNPALAVTQTNPIISNSKAPEGTTGKTKFSTLNWLSAKDIILLQTYAEETPISILHKSADFNRLKLKPEITDKKCTLYVDDKVLAQGTGLSNATAKEAAYQSALSSLRRVCWTLLRKAAADENCARVSVEQLQGTTDATTGRIDSGNIGNQMLRKMGWSGGGVGAEGREGRADPVTVDGVYNRAGLGATLGGNNPGAFKRRVVQILNDYIASDRMSDLIFTADVLKEERALIHRQAQILGLKSRSYGKDEDGTRYLVVARILTAQKILADVRSSGGSSDKYFAIPPSNTTITDRVIPKIESPVVPTQEEKITPKEAFSSETPAPKSGISSLVDVWAKSTAKITLDKKNTIRNAQTPNRDFHLGNRPALHGNCGLGKEYKEDRIDCSAVDNERNFGNAEIYVAQSEVEENYHEGLDHDFHRGLGGFGRGSFERGLGTFKRGRGSFDPGRGSSDPGRESLECGRGSFDPGRGSFERGRGSFDPGRGSFERGRGSFDPGRGSFDPGRGSFDPGRGSFECGRESFDPDIGSFDPGRGSFERGRGSFDPGRGTFDPDIGSFDPGRGSFDRGRGSFDPGRGSFDRGRGNIDRGRGNLKGGRESFDPGRGSFDRGRGSFDPGRGSFGRGRGSIDRGLGNLKGGRESFDPDRGSFDHGLENFERGRGSFDCGRENFDRGRESIHRGRGNFERGRGSFDCGRENFDRGRGSIHRGRGNFDRGRGNFDSGFARDSGYKFVPQTEGYDGGAKEILDCGKQDEMMHFERSGALAGYDSVTEPDYRNTATDPTSRGFGMLHNKPCGAAIGRHLNRSQNNNIDLTKGETISFDAQGRVIVHKADRGAASGHGSGQLDSSHPANLRYGVSCGDFQRSERHVGAQLPAPFRPSGGCDEVPSLSETLSGWASKLAVKEDGAS